MGRKPKPKKPAKNEDAELKKCKEELRVKVKELEKEINDCNNEITSCKDEFIKWSDELIDLEDKLDERERSLDSRENQIKRHESLDEREEKLSKDEKKVNGKSAKLKKREDDLRKEKAEIDRQDKDLKKRENDLLDREEDIKRRELDAEAGFAEKHRESLTQLDAEAEILRNELSNCRKQIADERAEWIKESEKERAELELELDQQRQEARKNLKAELDQKRKACDKEILGNKNALDAESEALKNDRNKLEEEERNLRKSQRNLDVDREIFEERLNAKAAKRVERLEFEKEEIQERLNAAREDRDELKEMLNRCEDAERKFGHKTADEILYEMEVLRNERDQLNEKLKSRPSGDAVARLHKLEAERKDCKKQKMQYEVKIAELETQLQKATIGVTELETLRDQKKALETSRELLQAALEELRADVEERIRSAEGKSPFPACSGMDENSNLQTSVRNTDQIPSLADFALDLQQRIAFDNGLYYSERDIRSFLGGLAMSHLHLLHGISGTGKTSLPLAFARAVGAGCTLVEVQAGWRDRQDLLGHFNSFERRYYESEFLQALYKAQCPEFQDRLYIVVLDEMNLSHPEQYFADMLSALEQDERRQILTLMTASVEPAPKMLKEGRKLRIPSNVWFVGTANQDETTKDFADKTYDRSHVMELPRHREQFEPEDSEFSPPIACNALKQAFENAKAKKEFADKAKKAYQFLESNLGEILGKSFRVGWGNRLERQMEDYVPVVIAAGGSIGEATDHILATKILRKIRDRYENEDRKDELRKLKHKIEDSWSGLYPKGEFEKLIKDEEVAVKHKAKRSLGIISYELRRLGEDEGS